MKMSGYEYLCSAGESWDSVALTFYGNEKYAAEIICANPEYGDRQVFSGDEVLLMPVVVVRATDGAGVPETAPWRD